MRYLIPVVVNFRILLLVNVPPPVRLLLVQLKSPEPSKSKVAFPAIVNILFQFKLPLIVPLIVPDPATVPSQSNVAPENTL